MGCPSRWSGFSAVLAPEDLIGRRLRAMAEKLCGGSLTPLLTHLVRAERLTAKQRQELRTLIDEEIEKLQREEPTEHELQRSINQVEASFYHRMERVGGKADQLNAYYTATGDPDWFNEDLARYRALSASDIEAAAAQFLPQGRRVELTVMPEGGTNKP